MSNYEAKINARQLRLVDLRLAAVVLTGSLPKRFTGLYCLKADSRTNQSSSASNCIEKELDNLGNMQNKATLYVCEGFSVLMITHVLGGLISLKLIEIFNTVPPITVFILSSSALSPVIAIAYLKSRIHFFPNFFINSETLAVAASGVVIVWLTIFVERIIFLGRGPLLLPRLLMVSPPYNYVNIFWYTFWAPLIEEVLFRGFFLNMLMKKWSVWSAVLVSSILFAFPHILFSETNVGLVGSSFLLMNSFIFSFVFIQGGIVAAVLTHAFNNIFFLFL